MSEYEILKTYAKMREIHKDIPIEILEFMKESALNTLKDDLIPHSKQPQLDAIELESAADRKEIKHITTDFHERELKRLQRRIHLARKDESLSCYFGRNAYNQAVGFNKAVDRLNNLIDGTIERYRHKPNGGSCYPVK